MRFFPVGGLAQEQRPAATQPKPVAEDAGKSHVLEAAGQAYLPMFFPQPAQLSCWILSQQASFAQELRANQIAMLQMQVLHGQWLAMSATPRCFRW